MIPEPVNTTADREFLFTGKDFNFLRDIVSGRTRIMVTDEKKNRTMEIMVTSVSPEQFIGGKAVGLPAS